MQKLPTPSKLFSGVLSDGQYSIPFRSLDEHLRTWLWTRDSHLKLIAPFSATINRIQLRVDNCFEAKVEAFVETFYETDALRHSQPGTLNSQPLVSTAPLVAQLLPEYCRGTQPRSEPDKMSQFSPRSLKSQASPVRREHETSHTSMDSSPISQMRLATQAPMTQAKHRQALKEVAHNVERPSSSKSSEAEARLVRNQQILAAAAKHHPQSKQRQTNERQMSATTKPPIAHDVVDEALAPEKEPDILNSDGRQALPRTARSQVVVSADTPSFDALHQGESMDVCIDVAAADRDFTLNSLAAQNSAAGASSKHRFTNRQTLPNDDQMKLRFRRWRAEGAAGRYIPRCACKIPKQQLEILEAEQSWHPPLPGRASREGAVPTELLISLNTEADERARRREAFTTDNQAEEQPQSPENRPSEKASYSLEDLPSSQELGESQWPPSPERPKPNDLLPPDSSLPSHDSPVGASQLEDNPESVSDGDQSMISSTRDRPRVDEEPNCKLTESAHVPQPAQPSKNSISPTESAKHERFARSHQHAELEVTSVAQRIQVHRTPFPGRMGHQAPKRMFLRPENARELLETHEPSTYVPCTFEEGRVQTRYAIDEATKDAKNICTEPPVIQPADHADLPQKRKTESDQVETPAKRTKINPSDPRLDREVSPSTARILQDKMDYRRPVLAAMSKPAKQSMAKPLPSGSSVTSVQRTTSSEQAPVSDSRRSLEGPLHPSTPPTILSSHHGSRSDIHMSKESETRNPQEPQTSVTNDVFSGFATRYGDYHGTQKDFEQAIKLLIRLQSLEKAPHPTLFDDFVFHHFHSYRPHIERCLESDESPAPYSKYFNSIEALCHNAKVLKASLSEQLYGSRPPFNETSAHRSTKASSLSHSRTHEQAMHAQETRDPDPASEPVIVTSLVEQDADHVQEDAREHMHPSQKSSVENWLEHTARAGSPDLGSPNVEPGVISAKAAELNAQSTAAVQATDRIAQKTGSPPTHQSQQLQSVPAAPLAPNKLNLGRTPQQREPRKKKRFSVSPFSLNVTPASNKPASKEVHLSREKETAFERWSNAYSNLPDEPRGPSVHVNPFAWRT